MRWFSVSVWKLTQSICFLLRMQIHRWGLLRKPRKLIIHVLDSTVSILPQASEFSEFIMYKPQFFFLNNSAFKFLTLIAFIETCTSTAFNEFFHFGNRLMHVICLNIQNTCNTLLCVYMNLPKSESTNTGSVPK